VAIVFGINRNHYEIPIVTTLLLVGPKGSGKALSLIIYYGCSAVEMKD
jgi:hypothetical protein